MAEPVLHVGLYSGLVVKHDAISTSVRLKLEVLEAMAAAGHPIRTTVFTQGSNVQHPAIRRVDGVHGLFREPDFATVDVHIFEFGIRYDLFNATFLIPPDEPLLAVYHNITPPELAGSPDARRTQERSLIQKHNLGRADHIVCDSEFSRDDLLRFGIAPTRLSVHHLPPMIPTLPRDEQRRGIVELLFVGRFVAAKGVGDLVQAVARLADRGVDGFRLTMVGNRQFSSSACLQQIEELMSAPEIAERVRIILSPPDDEVAALYARSDALVIPSYHEGYCVPVVEAFASGCYVIAYDSTNLPYVTGGLGTLVPTGDVDGLARAIEDYVRRVSDARERGREVILAPAAGELTEAEWRAAVSGRGAQYSREAFDRELVRLVGWAGERRRRQDRMPYAPADTPALTEISKAS
jgi:glycosyltransferase involved in cell wall biosynthesis